MEPTIVSELKRRKPRGGPAEKAFVALSRDTTAKIAQHLEEANRQLRGLQVTRTEFICWLLDAAMEVIGKEQLQNFKVKFQTEEGRLKWARQELKRRQSAGECPTLEEILKDEGAQVSAIKRPRRRKSDEILTAHNDSQGAKNDSNSENESLSLDRSINPLVPPKTGED